MEVYILLTITLMMFAYKYLRVPGDRKRWNRHDRRRDKYNRLAHH
jgi:hypothetical protein